VLKPATLGCHDVISSLESSRATPLISLCHGGARHQTQFTDRLGADSELDSRASRVVALHGGAVHPHFEAERPPPLAAPLKVPTVVPGRLHFLTLKISDHARAAESALSIKFELGLDNSSNWLNSQYA
jgi:hypothetical protein